MIRILKKNKVLITLILCISCLFFGLSVVKLTASAKEKSPYYIKVNKLQNCVTIYEKDKKGEYTIPIKAMTCSTGMDTPIGIYDTLAKYRWKLLMGDVWGQYSTRITRGILFHSVWYYEMDETTLSAKQYNKLGTSASHGCVRLTVADAKWIYDNCLVGTTVEIYSDKIPGPLGKPETLLLKEGTGWDPTDPSVKNPYNDNTPTIKGVTNQTIDWGKEIDLKKGVKATSSTGTDISSKLKIDGDVDIFTPGKYKIKYLITDAIGRKMKKTVTITVAECLEKPRFEGTVNRSISSDTVVDREFALKGVKAYLSAMELDQDDIEVNIVKATEDTYSIEYSIIGQNDLTGTAEITVAIDTTAPILDGISHKELTLKQLESGKEGIKKLALEDVYVKDDHSALSISQVKVTVKAKFDYAYLVKYEVADEVGNSTSETVQFTYYGDTRIDGVSNHLKVPYGTEITKEYVKQGITASNSEGDCTDKITFKISSYVGEEYIVTYSIPDETGYTISVASYFIVEEEPTVLDNVDAAKNIEENTDMDATENAVENPNDKTEENTDDKMEENTDEK